MLIIFNTDHTISATDEFKAPMIASLSEKLKKYSHQITKIDVHLSDENGSKGGPKDKRCLLEAHMAGMNPTVVKNHDSNYDDALDGAIDKLMSSLEKELGHLKNH